MGRLHYKRYIRRIEFRCVILVNNYFKNFMYIYIYRIKRGNRGTTDKRVILHEKNKLKISRILYEVLFPG